MLRVVCHAPCFICIGATLIAAARLGAGSMQATDEVPCLVLGGSSDALQCPAMEETKMSHASPFRGRRPILYLPRVFGWLRMRSQCPGLFI